jgi:hypothetical protein
VEFASQEVPMDNYLSVYYAITHIYTHTYTYQDIQVHTYTHTHKQINTYMPHSTQPTTQSLMHMHTHTTHTCTQLHTYIHTYIHTNKCSEIDINYQTHIFQSYMLHPVVCKLYKVQQMKSSVKHNICCIQLKISSVILCKIHTC